MVSQLAFFLPHLPRCFLDPLGKEIDHQKQHRNNGERDQSKAPVVIEHHADHARERQRVDQHAQQRRSNEVLNRFNIAGDPADQIAGSLFVVFRQGQVMDMLVERPPQVVHHPLADAGGQIFFRVGADRSHDRDHRHRQHREIQHRKFVVPANWLTIPASQCGKGFDCSRLSTMIFSGQGSSRSVTVSPITASRAKLKAFQCGRKSSSIFAPVGFCGRFWGGGGASGI